MQNRDGFTRSLRCREVWDSGERATEGGEGADSPRWRSAQCPGIRQAVVPVLNALPSSVQGSKNVMCPWWHGDTPKATDFLLEAVKLIDLSHDRLKGIERFFQKEIKRLL